MYLWDWIIKEALASTGPLFWSSIFLSLSLPPSLIVSFGRSQVPCQTALWGGPILYKWFSWSLPHLTSEKKELRGKEKEVSTSNPSLPPWSIIFRHLQIYQGPGSIATIVTISLGCLFCLLIFLVAFVVVLSPTLCRELRAPSWMYCFILSHSMMETVLSPHPSLERWESLDFERESNLLKVPYLAGGTGRIWTQTVGTQMGPS